MELQRAVGKLDEGVGTLKEQGKQNSEKLDKLNLRIYAATAVLVILGTLLGFLVNKGVDLLIQIVGKHWNFKTAHYQILGGGSVSGNATNQAQRNFCNTAI